MSTYVRKGSATVYLRVDNEDNLHLLRGWLELIRVETHGEWRFVSTRQRVSNVTCDSVVFVQRTRLLHSLHKSQYAQRT